jgi:RNA polymerase subunit RPABC4/transcription elongation factor Spt4
MLVLIIAVIIGLIPAAIAQSKGYNFFLWWLFGAALFIVALPVSLIIRPAAASRKTCPYCRESIRKDATICPVCNSRLTVAPPVSAYGVTPPASAPTAPPPAAQRTCPYCAEDIRPDTTICPHCRRDTRVPA